MALTRRNPTGWERFGKGLQAGVSTFGDMYQHFRGEQLKRDELALKTEELDILRPYRIAQARLAGAQATDLEQKWEFLKQAQKRHQEWLEGSRGGQPGAPPGLESFTGPPSGLGGVQSKQGRIDSQPGGGPLGFGGAQFAPGRAADIDITQFQPGTTVPKRPLPSAPGAISVPQVQGVDARDRKPYGDPQFRSGTSRFPWTPMYDREEQAIAMLYGLGGISPSSVGLTMQPTQEYERMKGDYDYIRNQWVNALLSPEFVKQSLTGPSGQTIEIQINKASLGLGAEEGISKPEKWLYQNSPLIRSMQDVLKNNAEVYREFDDVTGRPLNQTPGQIAVNAQRKRESFPQPYTGDISQEDLVNIDSRTGGVLPDAAVQDIIDVNKQSSPLPGGSYEERDSRVFSPNGPLGIKFTNVNGFPAMYAVKLAPGDLRQLQAMVPVFNILDQIDALGTSLNDSEQEFYSKWRGLGYSAAAVVGLGPQYQNVVLLQRYKQAFASLFAEISGEEGRKTDRDVERALNMLTEVGLTGSIHDELMNTIYNLMDDKYRAIVHGPISHLESYGVGQGRTLPAGPPVDPVAMRQRSGVVDPGILPEPEEEEKNGAPRNRRVRYLPRDFDAGR